MKIVICGSVSFGKDMLVAKEQLEKLGHQVAVPANIGKYVSGELSVEGKWEKLENDVIRSYFEKIKQSDAVLIINKDKNGIANYVGGNGLIEMAFAHVLGKSIFLLNPPPDMNYRDEIEAMQPVVINNNLSLIK